MQANHPFRHLLAHCETFWDILSNFEQIWANLSNFEQFWVILSNLEQFWANFEQSWAVFLGQLEQFWAFLSGKCGSCRAILNNFWKHDMALLTMDSVQNVSIELWDILLWLKKVADVNPTDLDPKTRSVGLTPQNPSYSLRLWWKSREDPWGWASARAFVDLDGRWKGEHVRTAPRPIDGEEPKARPSEIVRNSPS